MNEPYRYYVERKKPDAKEHILCDSIYVKLQNRQKKSMVIEITAVVAQGRRICVWKRLFREEQNAGTFWVKEMFTVLPVGYTYTCVDIDKRAIEYTNAYISFMQIIPQYNTVKIGYTAQFSKHILIQKCFSYISKHHNSLFKQNFTWNSNI